MDKSRLVLSAHSLQAFADCARRFELTYLKRLKWPAIEQEPVLQYEQFMADGRLFHQMIERDLMGLDVQVPLVAHESDIDTWWANYQAFRPGDLPGRKFPEKRLVGSVGTFPLTATYDLICVGEKGRVTIVDWKTWRKPPDRDYLRHRLQTRVYPFLLAQAGASLTGNAISPEDLEMVYWYASHPEERVVFSYDATQYLEDLAYLQELADQIAALLPEAFPLTDDDRHCQRCVYRSYCERGRTAGAFAADTDDAEEDGLSLFGNLDDYESISF